MIPFLRHLAHGLFNDLDVLRNPPVVVLGELLQANHAGRRHGQRLRAATLAIGESARMLPLLFVRGFAWAAFGLIMLADVADGALDHRRPNFKSAIDRAPQGLGLHDRQAEVVAGFSRVGLVIPAAVQALALVDHLQGTVQGRPDARIAGHAISLTEHEGRQAVVIHVKMLAGDVQQPEAILAVAKHVIQGVLPGCAKAAVAGGVPIGQKGQQSHAHQAEVIRRPIALRPLIPLQPEQTAIKGLAALRRNFPGTIAPQQHGNAQSKSAAQINAHQG